MACQLRCASCLTSCCTCQARSLRKPSRLNPLKCNCEGARMRAFWKSPAVERGVRRHQALTEQTARDGAPTRDRSVHAMSTTIVSILNSSSRVSAVETHMTKLDISGIAPFFIVKNVPAALSFYRDRLGFDITFQGPDPDDIFFGIVQRGGAMIMVKDVGVDPLPNYKRDVKKGWARWDAYLHVPDPDALAAEFSSRNVELAQPLKDDDDGLRGFELKDADGYVLFFGRPRS